MDEEASIISNAQRGDEDAFGSLVHAYHDRVMGLLVRMTGDPVLARELEQQTWIKVWRNLKKFRGNSAFFTWLYSIATRTALDYFRKHKRRAEVEYLDERAGGDDGMEPERPDRHLMRHERGEEIKRAMNLLPDKLKTVLILREVEGLSYREIAEIVKCREGTVMSRLHHARKKMRVLLKGESS